ncbi:MAG TPA: hypothetical protein VFP34_03205, partial [Microlunatus sp.]|nr:hypothetical protein [Microlunatus sp.]
MTQLAVAAGYDHDVAVRHRAGHPAHAAPRPSTASGPAGTAPTARRVGGVTIAQLQRMAGNRAVAGLLGRPAQTSCRQPVSTSGSPRTSMAAAAAPEV